MIIFKIVKSKKKMSSVLNFKNLKKDDYGGIALSLTIVP